MSIFNDVKSILVGVLQLQSTAELKGSSPLLGAIPEFDSMAVVSILTALEEKFGFFVEDDEIDAEIFETMESLVTFVEQKLG